MALRDQPYLPLFIQDFLTDEKLMECSASATGVYIRIMCILHKSDPYGKFLLRQKDRQKDRQILNFADKFAKHLPYTIDVIVDGLTELIEEGCLHIEGDYLIQKRMVRDNELSIKRSKSGSKGAEVTNNKHKQFASAKSPANTEYENENIYSIILRVLEDSKVLNGEGENEKNVLAMLIVEMEKIWLKEKPEYCSLKEVDYPALMNMAYHIAARKGWTKHSVTDIREMDVINSWTKIVLFLKSVNADNYLKKLTLDGLANPKNMQRVEEAMKQLEGGNSKRMIL